MKRRDANAILIAFAAVSGAVIAYSLPLRLYEIAISTSGLSELVPAAAPPLGSTARALILIISALTFAIVAALILPWGSGEGKRGKSMSFAFLRFGWFGRRGEGRGNGRRERLSFLEDVPVFEPEGTPVVRRSDAHPDAPPRSPVFASRDLGEHALPPMQDEEPEYDVPRPMVHDITGFSAPRAPEPMPWEAIQQEMERLLANARSQAPVVEPVPPEPAPTQQLSISELADRLERGLAARQARRQSEASVIDSGLGGLA